MSFRKLPRSPDWISSASSSGQTRVHLWKKCLSASDPGVVQMAAALIKGAQASTRLWSSCTLKNCFPLITLLNRRHGFIPPLLLRARLPGSVWVPTHTTLEKTVLKESECLLTNDAPLWSYFPDVHLPSPDAAKHPSWHQRFNWNNVQPVEIKALNRISKPLEAGLTFPLTGLIMSRSDGELPTRPPAPLAPSPCGKSQWQELKGAEGNVKYGCSDACEWPAGRRSCGGEGGHWRQMSGRMTSTHVLLEKTPTKPFVGSTSNMLMVREDYTHQEAEIWDRSLTDGGPAAVVQTGPSLMLPWLHVLLRSTH